MDYNLYTVSYLVKLLLDVTGIKRLLPIGVSFFLMAKIKY